MRNTPTMHEDFEIDQRVSFDMGGLKGTGTIVGISWQHIIFGYIVLLDQPINVPDYDKAWRAIIVPGGELTKI